MSEGSSQSDLLDQIADEFLERQQDGESPSVDDYCSRYPELANEIRSLLKTIGLAHDFLGESNQPMSMEERIPSSLAGYRIIQEIGRGGMGIVYEAEHDTLKRRVALKVISGHYAKSSSAAERFQREARVIAKLHHSNIVPLFEVGEDQGKAFLAMQLIQGQSLDQVIMEIRDANSGSRADRLAREPRKLELDSSGSKSGSQLVDYLTASFDGSSNAGVLAYYRSVAEIAEQISVAIAYAHARAVIHRDIKPSNLILDSDGVVWVTDFGLAKTEEEGMTQTGDFLGTLRYMSPERFDGVCDERADIYAIGVTLYEMLVLRPAHAESDRLRILDSIRNLDPPRPRSIDPRIPADLETITLKAIEREPKARYHSAEEIANDLQRFLDDVPILARRISPIERLLRWSRRNKRLAGSLFSIASLLVVLAVGSVVALNRETILRGEAELETQRAETEKNRADLKSEQLRQKLYAAQISRAEAAYRDDRLGVMQQLIDECPEDLRDWEWARCKWLAAPRELLKVRGFELPLFTPDGQLLIAAGHRADADANVANVWDMNNGQLAGEGMTGPAVLMTIALRADGKRLATGYLDGTVSVWDFPTRKRLWSKSLHSRHVDGLAFTPDGARLASVSRDQTLKVLNTDTAEVLTNIGPVGHGLRCVAFDPAGDRVVSAAGYANADIAPKVWDTRSGEELVALQAHPGVVLTVDVSPDGRHIITGSTDRTMRLWEMHSGRELKTFYGHRGAVEAVAFSPDGKRVASGSNDRTLRIWDITTEKEIAKYRSKSAIPWLSFNRDGDRIASFDVSGIRVWDSDGVPDELSLWHGSYINDCAFSPSGKQVASCGEGGTVKLWDPRTGELISVLQGHEAMIYALAWHPMGRLIASASLDQTVRLFDTHTGQQIRSLSLPRSRVVTIAFSPNGSCLACGNTEGAIVGFDPKSGDKVFEFDGGAFSKLTWSPDGRTIATCGADNQVSLWNAETRELKQRVQAGAFGVTFSPDSARVAAAKPDGTIMIGDCATGKVQLTLSGHLGAVKSLQFSPNGRRLFSGSATLKVWDTHSGEELLSIQGHDRGVRSVSVSPDGKTVASTSGETLRLWVTETSVSHSAQSRNVRKAADRVDQLFRKHTFADKVLESLRADAELDAAVRDPAIRIVNATGNRAFTLFNESWPVLLSADGDPDQYEQALRKLQAACKQVPDSAAFRTALGVAHYRVGQNAKAYAALAKARQAAIVTEPLEVLRSHGELPQAVYPVNMAFNVMTLHQLSRHEESRAMLVHLRKVMQAPRLAHYADAVLACREAEQVAGTSE